MEKVSEFAAREAQAAQEISRIEAFMASDFTCDEKGMVSYQHFVTRAREKILIRKLYITRTQTPYQSYQEHFSSMCNYVSQLYRVLQHCMTHEKYLADPYGYEPICKKIDELTSADTDNTTCHKKTITVYKTVTAQDLAQIAVLNFYSFMTSFDLEGHEKIHGQAEKDQLIQYRSEFLRACAQQSVDQIRNLLAQQKALPFYLKPYRQHSTCTIVEQWIDNEKRDFKNSES